MKKNLLTIILMILTLCACSTKEDEPKLPEELLDAKVAWLQLGEKIDESKILFLCSDKSYAIFDGDSGDGRMTLYFNSSVENDISKGTMIYMDPEGTPEMIRMGNEYILIDNLNESTFDMAYRKSMGGYEYYWDIPFVTWADSRSHSFFYYLYPGVTDFDWSWDEHIAAAIWPFLLKEASFLIDAAMLVYKPSGTSFAGVITKLAEEMRKSGFKLGFLDEVLIAGLTPLDILNKLGLDGDEFFKGKLKFSPLDFDLNALSSTLNRMGDEGLNRLGQMKEVTKPVFTGREWQLKPNPAAVSFDPKADKKLVHIDSKSYWVLDESGLDKSWCTAVKDGENIVITVKGNEQRETRNCSLKVRTQMYSADIPSVVIHITQHGVKFDVSPTSLTFKSEGGSKAVAIDMSNNITSWDVTSKPTWVSIEKGKESFFVNVKKSKEIRSSIITVTGYAGDGISIDRQITVEQGSYAWDTTAWNFSGPVSCSVMGETYTDNWNFGIDIVNVSKNTFSLSGSLAGYESYFKLRANEDGTLDMIYNETIAQQGVSGNATCIIHIIRVDAENAKGNVSGDIFARMAQNGNIKLAIKGNLTGRRTN